MPLIQGVHRLGIEMTVDQHGGSARGLKPVAVNHGVASDRRDSDRFDPGSFHSGLYPFGSPLDVGLMIGQAGNAGDTQKLEQFVDELVLVFIEISFPIVHGLCSPIQ